MAASVLWHTLHRIRRIWRRIPSFVTDIPDMAMVRVGKKILHEQHNHAYEPGAAHHEIHGSGELADCQLRLRNLGRH